MKTVKMFVLIGALHTLAMPASAQQIIRSPFTFSAFAGAAIPNGDLADGVNTGYILGGAVDFTSRLMAPLGLRGEASYTSLGAKSSVTGPSASGKVTDLGANLNFVLWFPMPAPSTVTPYFTAGGNYSKLEASARSGSVSVTESQNHFGFNAGGGIDIGIGGLAARIDARYKRISTDEEAFTYIPITVGIRF